MKVGITGASGLIGTALTASLIRSGHHVTRFVRPSSTTPRRGQADSSADTDTVEWDIEAGRLDPSQLIGLDAVVHLAGAGIGDHRWTAAYRQKLIDSRVDSTTLLATAMAGVADGDGPTTLVSGSAIGYYGNRGDEVLTEQSPAGTGFLPELCMAWEAATKPASTAGRRVALLRTGIVLSPKGGALSKMLPLFKLGLGGRFGGGTQWMSWITIDDQVRAIEHLLATDIEGPVNVTSPQPAQNKDFARLLGTALSRPSRLPVPAFGPRLLLGRDLANNLLFDSQRVIPERLETLGFEFEYPELGAAFEHLT